MDKLIAVIPAAGAGKRMGMGMNKAFVPVREVPILVHCMKMLAETNLIARAIVVLAADEVADGEKLLQSYSQKYFPQLPFCVVAGGKERQDSVANALAVIEEENCYLAVHDGARPFAGREVFERTLAAAKKYGAAIAAVPVKNTIKVVDNNGKVVATPVRSSLQAVQTPQIFAVELLKKAYAYLKEHPVQVTDDASVVELLGKDVFVAQGRYENIKITTPEDLIFAENFLKRQEQEDE